MGKKVINPTSPGQRGMIKDDFADITTSKPEKSLLKPIRKTACLLYTSDAADEL